MKNKKYSPPSFISHEIHIEETIAVGSLALLGIDKDVNTVDIEDWQEKGGFDDTEYTIN